MRHKLLLADDSATIQRVVELTFSGEDFEVVAVADGEQAIARIPEERPDIVLADIAMPKLSGYDVAAFVKQTPALSHIPVLLLTGAFEPVDEARAAEVGSDGVLVKPFEPRQVIARVRELVEARKAQRVPLSAERDLPVLEPAALFEGTAGEPGPPREGADRDAVPASQPAAHAGAAPGPVAQPSGPAAGQSELSLDDYFDRLDAAFASLGPPMPATADAIDPPAVDDLSTAPADVPTIERVLGAAPTRSTETEPAPSLDAPIATGAKARATARNPIAEVFRALLAAERGEPAPDLTWPPRHPVVTEQLVDEVTRRVLERLAPDAVRGAVAQVVADVAERLVREEIDRIRGPR